MAGKVWSDKEIEALKTAGSFPEWCAMFPGTERTYNSWRSKRTEMRIHGGLEVEYSPLEDQRRALLKKISNLERKARKKESERDFISRCIISRWKVGKWSILRWNK